MHRVPTEAAMSDHRFARPLEPQDVFHPIAIEPGNLDLDLLKNQTQEHAEKRAKEASKRHQIPEKADCAEHAYAMAERILGLLVMSRYRRGPVQFVNEAQADFTA